MSRGLSSQVRATLVSFLALAAGAALPAAAQTSVDEGFTYQGRLSEDGVLATGVYDLQFQLFDVASAGVPIRTFDAADVQVTSGLFQTKVFFSKQIQTTDKRWMQVLVRPGASTGAFTPLGDRQELNAVPFATTVIHPPTFQAIFDAASFPSLVVSGKPLSVNPGAASDTAFVVQKGRSEFGISHAAPGTIQMRNAASISNFTSLLGTFTSGAGIGDGLALWDVNGSTTLDATRAYAFIGPGPQANGGRVTLARDQNGVTGIDIVGNQASGNPKLSMLGAGGSSVVFDLTSVSGPGKVQLPTDSIQSEEISDEPGVTSANLAGASAVSTALSTIRSSTITTPDAGFVIVFASAKATIAHVTGTNTSVTYGVSNALSLPGSQSLAAQIPASAPTGSYVIPVSSHAVFSASQGVATFFFNALRAGAAGSSASIADSTISCLYIPTSYGNVSAPTPPGAPSGPAFVPPMTFDDIRREQSSSVAANDQRIANELAAMRQRCEQLEAELRQRPTPVLTTGRTEAK